MKKKITKVLCVLMSAVCIISSGSISAFADETAVSDYASTQTTQENTATEPSSDEYKTKVTRVEFAKFTENSVSIIWEDIFSYETEEEYGYELALVRPDGTYKKATTTKIKRVTSCIFKTTITGLNGAKKYTVAVRPYIIFNGQYLYGPYSKGIEVATAVTKKTKLKSVAQAGNGKIKLKWSKVDSASGYIVQYSVSKKFSSVGTVSIPVKKNSTTSKTIKGLANTTLYVRVCPYKAAGDSYYCGEWSSAKKIKVKSNLTVKQMLNSVKCDNKMRKHILEATKNGVDIKKYKTTYDKVKAIYNWHAKHYKDFASCVMCNGNFDFCVSMLFYNNPEAPAITTDTGYVKNSDGTTAGHTWSVIYLGGAKHIFDPRLQGYTHDYTGNLYFGVRSGKGVSRIYVPEYIGGTCDRINMYFANKNYS